MCRYMQHRVAMLQHTQETATHEDRKESIMGYAGTDTLIPASQDTKNYAKQPCPCLDELDNLVSLPPGDSIEQLLSQHSIRISRHKAQSVPVGQQGCTDTIYSQKAQSVPVGQQGCTDTIYSQKAQSVPQGCTDTIYSHKAQSVPVGQQGCTDTIYSHKAQSVPVGQQGCTDTIYSQKAQSVPVGQQGCTDTIYSHKAQSVPVGQQFCTYKSTTQGIVQGTSPTVRLSPSGDPICRGLGPRAVRVKNPRAIPLVITRAGTPVSNVIAAQGSAKADGNRTGFANSNAFAKPLLDSIEPQAGASASGDNFKKMTGSETPTSELRYQLGWQQKCDLESRSV
ncbi:hypothetical protein Bbelb_025780 [Branchiostoma belcheri]|nr:hypothetical protein Bbelb_025780 [Branchiostoma belcheri]